MDGGRGGMGYGGGRMYDDDFGGGGGRFMGQGKYFYEKGIGQLRGSYIALDDVVFSSQMGFIEAEFVTIPTE